MNTAESYAVITGHAVGNDRAGFHVVYDWDRHAFASKPEAVSHGFEVTGSDDFNVGVIRDGKLESLWWMENNLREPAQTLARIGGECGIEGTTPRETTDERDRS